MGFAGHTPSIAEAPAPPALARTRAGGRAMVSATLRVISSLPRGSASARPRFGGPRDRVGTARHQKTWSIDVPSIGRLRPLPHEPAADSVERFAQAADRAGHEVTEAAVQAWYQAAIEAGAVATRPRLAHETRRLSHSHIDGVAVA